MINLGFTINREIVTFRIEDRKITYFDRKWTEGVPFIPRDAEYIKKLLLHQRQFPFAQQIIAWIEESNSGKNEEEYKSCTTDEQIAELVRRDAMSKGLMEIKIQ